MIPNKSSTKSIHTLLGPQSFQFGNQTLGLAFRCLPLFLYACCIAFSLSDPHVRLTFSRPILSSQMVIGSSGERSCSSHLSLTQFFRMAQEAFLIGLPSHQQQPKKKHLINPASLRCDKRGPSYVEALRFARCRSRKRVLVSKL